MLVVNSKLPTFLWFCVELRMRAEPTQLGTVLMMKPLASLVLLSRYRRPKSTSLQHAYTCTSPTRSSLFATCTINEGQKHDAGYVFLIDFRILFLQFCFDEIQLLGPGRRYLQIISKLKNSTNTTIKFNLQINRGFWHISCLFIQYIRGWTWLGQVLPQHIQIAVVCVPY